MLEETGLSAKNKDLQCPAAATALSWRIYLAIFLLAAAISAMHHTLEPGIKTALQFDGRHYFESCQRTTALVLSLFSGNAASIAAAEQALRPWILLDGPVLPVVFGLGFSLFGHVPASSDWSLLLIGQTILQAISATAIARLVLALTGSRMASCLAALGWALYPAAIIASGRLMTETLASCLLLALPLSCYWARRSKAGGIAGGLVAAALILLKPGMIPSVVLTIAILLAFSKKRALLAITLAAGLAIGLSPWMGYTKFGTGITSLTVQRLPVHNALIGWDPETGGWQTSPPSAFERVMNSGSEPLPVVAGIWRSFPLESLRILCEKPGHLYLVPWNDYRATVWGMDAKLQQVIHVLYVAMLLFGSACLIIRRRQESVDEAMLPILCLSSAAGQFIYIMFEPVCRYAFPLMVFAPVLGSAGVHGLFCAKPGQRKATALIATSFTAVILILLALSAGSASRRQIVISKNLSPGDKLDIQLLLRKPIDTRCDTAMLLIDCDRRFAPTDLRVDNHSLGAPPLLPFALFDEQKSKSFNLLREFAYTFGKEIDDFRQWRAMPVPIEDLQGKTSINVSIRQGNAPATIYGLAARPSRAMLSSDYLDVNRMINSPDSLEPRVLDPVQTGGSNRMMVNGNLETATFMGTAVHLALGMPKTGTVLPKTGTVLPRTDERTNSHSSPDQAPWSLDIDPHLFDPLLRDRNIGTLIINRAILKAAQTNAAIVTVPKSPSACLSLKLTGSLKCDRKIGSLGLVVSSVTASGAQSILCRLPKAIAATQEWQSFEIADLLPNNNLKDPIEKLSISVFPGPWQQVAGYGCDKSCSTVWIRSLKLTLKPTDLPSFTNRQVFYY